MTYHLRMQVSNISSNGEINTLLVYPNFKSKEDSIAGKLGYRLCNEIYNHHYYLWFHNLYGHGEAVTIAKITSIYDTWCLAKVRPANPIEEFDFKYHRELTDLLEDDSIGLLFELGKKKDE